MPVSEADLCEFREFKKEMFRVMAHTINCSQHPTAQEVINFLRNNLIISTLSGNTITYHESCTGTRPTALVIVRQQDKGLSSLTDSFLDESSTAAAFQTGLNGIMIKTFMPMSDLWKGVLILHEGHHAKILRYTDRKLQDDPEFHFQHERDTIEFQLAVVRRSAGASYVSLVERMIKEAMRWLESQGKSGNFFDDVFYPEDEMNKIFGPAISSHETNSRYTHWMYEIQFGILDLLPWNIAQQRKAQYVKFLQEKHPFSQK